MASLSALSSPSFKPSFAQVNGKATNSRVVPVSWGKSIPPSPRTSRFNISCAAKPETLEKVCGVVRKQLVLPDDANLTAESKFSELGADSLDTVEIVMSLEEKFGIAVEEENSQNIATVQDAAELIDTLLQKKAES